LRLYIQRAFKQHKLFLVILLLHTVASFYYIAHQNITADEPDYIEYAKRWLHGKPERIRPLDDSKSPIVAVCWVPRIVRQIINPGYQLNDYGRKDQAEGRYMMIVFSFLAALYVYWWCKDLYGGNKWIMPLVLLLFDPLYLAYSTLITTDLACGAFLVALLYHFRKYLLLGQPKQLLLAAFFTGVAIVTKQTMLFVVFLLPLLSVLFSMGTKRKFNGKHSLINTAVFIGMILFVINSFYYFHHSFIPLGKYSFQSDSLRDVQHALSLLHWLPVPLPESFVQSIDMIKAHAEYGGGKADSTFNGVYLLGQLRLQDGFWYYYVVLLFYKMPIGTMLLFIGCVPLLVRGVNKNGFVKSYMFLFIPAVYYFIILSFFNDFQIGVRHILLIFPLMYIGLGKLFYELNKSAFKYKVAAAIAVAYTFITVAMYYPYIISYTNEFLTDKKMVYKITVDSSIDYGQSDSSVNDFIKLHPSYKTASPVTAVGKFVLPINHMLNRDKNGNRLYEWYQSIEPKAVYKYVILLYDIQEEDLKKAGYK